MWGLVVRKAELQLVVGVFVFVNYFEHFSQDGINGQACLWVFVWYGEFVGSFQDFGEDPGHDASQCWIRVVWHNSELFCTESVHVRSFVSLQLLDRISDYVRCEHDFVRCEHDFVSRNST